MFCLCVNQIAYTLITNYEINLLIVYKENKILIKKIYDMTVAAIFFLVIISNKNYLNFEK